MTPWEAFGIQVQGQSGPEVCTTCPECSPHRKKKNARCLSVNTEKGVWVCHHCGWRGCLKEGIWEKGETKRWKAPPRKPVYHPSSDGTATLESWFAAREIPRAIWEAAGVSLGRVYMPQTESEMPVVRFPYYRNGEVVNVKYRGLAEKVFRQETGAEKIFYGLDDVLEDQVVIVEGEIDKLSVQVAGLTSVISVPDGAPPEGSTPSSKKFEYIDNCHEYLEGVKKIIIAVDRDVPGQVLEQELIRRFGEERCWSVQWPDGCKDANDVLLKQGPKALASCIDQATPVPIQGVATAMEFLEPLSVLYAQGIPKGASTGWLSVDQLYTVKVGEVTVVTGIPSSGKSEWLDALTINLMQQQAWRFGFFSPENYPIERHVAKLVEKYTGFPLRLGPTARLSWSDTVVAVSWLDERAFFIEPTEEQLRLETVLTLARALVRRYGIRGLVLDPWNELDHSRPSVMTETEYISESLSRIRRFARKNGVHVWIVAHPMKLKKNEDGAYSAPTPYDISGSAHWRNKADNCITIHRSSLTDADRPVEVHVQKIRFRDNGSPGLAMLYWDKMSGRYRAWEAAEKDGA